MVFINQFSGKDCLIDVGEVGWDDGVHDLLVDEVTWVLGVLVDENVEVVDEFSWENFLIFLNQLTEDNCEVTWNLVLVKENVEMVQEFSWENIGVLLDKLMWEDCSNVVGEVSWDDGVNDLFVDEVTWVD